MVYLELSVDMPSGGNASIVLGRNDTAGGPVVVATGPFSRFAVIEYVITDWFQHQHLLLQVRIII